MGSSMRQARGDALERHGVGPLERHAGNDECVDGLLSKLNLDPGEVRRQLHLLHLEE